ncbi:MAG: chemotaxis-specific protein-glutamate methyltransferase CheB [bacterium]|nr:chemotaxis-specific protein-glutamate methyltransferase CheB [bacterium]
METEKKEKIRVLIVDDSPTIRMVLEQFLLSDNEIEVVGKAENGKEGVELVTLLKPDIVTMDFEMPVMTGLEATEQIMGYHPTPIVIFTSSLDRKGNDLIFNALDKGALAVVGKPKDIFQMDPDFIKKIKLLSKVPVITHLYAVEKDLLKSQVKLSKKINHGKIIGIACSTGGPDALKRILSKLPQGFPVPIAIVQHLAEDFDSEFINWLRIYSNIPLHLIEDGLQVKPGIGYIAPTTIHSMIDEDGIFRFQDSPPLYGCKPSGDVLLSSIAENYRENALGVILTGMGMDGAKGMLKIKENGGKTIAQDEESSIIFGMPKVAIELGAIQSISPLDLIPNQIIKML